MSAGLVTELDANLENCDLKCAFWILAVMTDIFSLVNDYLCCTVLAV